MVQRLTQVTGRALVVVPTRELAYQVDQTLQKLAHPFNMRTAVLIGGAPMHSQIQLLKKHPRIIIATPGRLLDHAQQRTVDISDVQILVIDEADRMFDMGFAPDMERIIRHVSKDRQTLLFSATMPSSIVNLTTRHMKLPLRVEIAPAGTATELVTHELFIVKHESKKMLLGKVLAQYQGSVLMFVRTKAGAQKITRLLKETGQLAAEIHSDRSMAQRRQALEGFKAGRYRVLVATDIAARGIDVTGIELVINYDLPDDAENYVHRIGRTGRAGHQGHAISFATPDQGGEVKRIEHMIRTALPISQHAELTTDQFINTVPVSTSRYGTTMSFHPRVKRRGGRRMRR
jgi:ATP-dependent RNA helicase RhlE